MNEMMILVGLVVGAGLLAAVSWKWCLPARASGLIIALGVLVAGGTGWFLSRSGLPVLLLLGVVPAVQLVVYVAVLAYRFYRDPERVPPTDPAAVVSPADGTVIYIRRLPVGSILRCDKKSAQLIVDELEGTPLVSQELWQIGISMVFTDVHVNRAPIAGKVALARHRPGKFLSLRIPEAVNVNERQTMLFDNGRFQLAIVQIASRLVRRIQAYVKEGQQVDFAQRVGMIKFGSQVDVFLPVSAVTPLLVTEGDELVAGETIITTAKPKN